MSFWLRTTNPHPLIEKTTTKIEEPKEETPVETNKIEQKTQTPEIKIENKKPEESGREPTKTPTERNISIERTFTAKDLSKVGTEFESENFIYKITKVTNGWFSIPKVETLVTNTKTGEVTAYTYYRKQLEEQLELKNIKITKAGN